MNKQMIRTSTLALALIATGSAFAQSSERKAFVLPHVLEAKASNLCAPRDVATGQSSGKRSADYYLQIDKAAVTAACDGAATGAQTVRESPTLMSTKGHTKTGHVTLMK